MTVGSRRENRTFLPSGVSSVSSGVPGISVCVFVGLFVLVVLHVVAFDGDLPTTRSRATFDSSVSSVSSTSTLSTTTSSTSTISTSIPRPTTGSGARGISSFGVSPESIASLGVSGQSGQSDHHDLSDHHDHFEQTDTPPSSSSSSVSDRPLQGTKIYPSGRRHPGRARTFGDFGLGSSATSTTSPRVTLPSTIDSTIDPSKVDPP